MIDPTSAAVGAGITLTVGTLLKFEDWIKKHWDDKSKEKKEAANALCEALRKTKIYINKLESGECQLSKQEDLFEYWDIACDKLYNLDLDLALLCNGKGRYWLRPESWTYQEIVDAGIEINKITEDIEKFKQKK